MSTSAPPTSAAGTPTRAGRRGPSKGDLKQMAILDTAEQLLAERTLAEVSVDDLAAGADISRSGFYFYFGSKEEALMALVERTASDLQAETERWLGELEDDPRAAIEQALRATARQWREHAAMLRATVEAGAAIAELQEVWQAVQERFVAATAAKIADERERGRAPAGPAPRQLATALVYMTERCFYMTTLGLQPSLGGREIVAVLTELWMRAIYGEPG
jgi:AcrR family transcriptional regulator